MAKETPRVQATLRDRLGTRYATRLRRSGKLPAVVYGHKEEPTHVAIDRHELLDHLQGGSHMLELAIDGGTTETCLLKDIQYDHLGTEVIHVDLARTSLTDEVEVIVAIELKGRNDAPGAKATGAIVEHSIVDLNVRCRADAIPDAIVVDMSHLDVGESITVGEVSMPPGVVTDHPPDDAVVGIHMVEEVEEVEAEAEAPEGEPEVLRAGKEEEREEKAEG